MSRGKCVVKWRDLEGMVMSYRCHGAFVVLELCLGASGRDFCADRRRSKRFSRVSRLVFELLLWWGTRRFVIWACLHWFGLCLHLRETIFVDTQKICFSSCSHVFLGPSLLGDSQNRSSSGLSVSPDNEWELFGLWAGKCVSQNGTPCNAYFAHA